MFNLKVICSVAQSSPSVDDGIGSALVSHVLDDSMSPLSVTVAACAVIVSCPSPSLAARAQQLNCVIRNVAGKDDAFCPLISDDNFFQPVFNVAVMQILGCAALEMSLVLADDPSVFILAHFLSLMIESRFHQNFSLHDYKDALQAPSISRAIDFAVIPQSHRAHGSCVPVHCLYDSICR